MGILILGSGGTVAEADGTLTAEVMRTVRICNRPVDFGVQGFHSINAVSGVMAAGMAANGEIFQARWIDPNRIAAIYNVGCDGAGVNAITAFAAGFAKMESILARNWTADGTGGTALSQNTPSNKMRSSMGNTQMMIRIPTTAALGAGTKTLDSQGLGAAIKGVVNVAGVRVLQNCEIFSATAHNHNHPIILGSATAAAWEGLIVRATVPATGTWTCGISMKWAELAAF